MAGVRRVLLVDDDPFDQALIRSAFTRIGSDAQVDVVSDIAHAMDHLENPDLPMLTIVDLKLRGESGLDLVRTVRTDARRRLMPMVVLSGSDDPVDVRACYDAGANAYLVKPQTLEGFDDLVDRLDAFWLGACSFVETLAG